jgi:hypothetical protein
MPKSRRQDGVVYARKDGKILWIRYWDRNGKSRRESSHTADWGEANRKLRERLQARDGNLLEVRNICAIFCGSLPKRGCESTRNWLR